MRSRGGNRDNPTPMEIKLIYTKFECKDCLQLLTKSSSNLFSAGSVRVMLDKNASDYFPSTLFYDYINNLLTCFRNNIMSVLYKMKFMLIL